MDIFIQNFLTLNLKICNQMMKKTNNKNHHKNNNNFKTNKIKIYNKQNNYRF